MNIFTEAAKLEEQNCPFAMAQIVDSRGSTPRHSAQMLVRADGSIVGTIGGGMVERKVIEESLQALQERKPRLFHGRMARNGADAVGSDCGGAMSVFISVHGMRPRLVLIGAGDIASGVALRLYHAGFKVIMLEVEKPTVIRCTVAFAQAVFDGEMTVEGVTARLATSSAEAMKLTERGFIPVMVDPTCSLLDELKPLCVVDAILAKQNLGTRADMAPVTIALGPGFTAGKDCHAVIETNRGHWLGQVIYSGCAQENTGVPGNIMGHTTRRVIRAPAAGIMRSNVKLGDLVKEGDVIAWIGEHEIKAPLTGMVRGLLNDGLAVVGGFKIGDIDPRGETADFTSVSDKARAIGGGVLEALMMLMHQGVKATKEVLEVA
ncbi:selenium-dependent molybdenum cofactor biosynthesis protein YqeB [Escherichia coli]|uniref:selenium-dependent molybdenum cofactor biosynthesis protein YqeB n=1 Tax=Escherichia coli TaxID=562 RepID=UPI001981D025|nr:selenium-dependent molybdenum cofactor biosynthesis protein YqeB [Escherichia coli]